ncbi:MAG: peptidoglycan DD-metalloendopeptidase family protein [Clostridia bacterium]|nr:peptidoglycan DD-metalloendopeptidase family protein [Clostridia bacterium]
MNNVNKKRTAPKRMRNLPSKSRTFKPISRAAAAAGVLTLSLIFTSCGETEHGTTAGTQGSTGKPAGNTSATTEVTTAAPAEKDGTHETTRFEEIPFETVYIPNPEMYEDEELTQAEGEKGKAEITEYRTYLGGELTAEWEERKTLTEPKNRVIIRGTKPIITVKENTVTETLEKYSTIYEECGTMEVGTTKLKTEGKNSVAVKTYRYTYTKGELTVTELVAEEIQERVDEVILVGTKAQSFGMPFIDAENGGVNYRLTQSYGGSNNHRGLDFAVYYGDPIIAVMDGTVVEAYDAGYFSKNNLLWTYGTYVVIEHEGGFRTCYAHLSSRTVKKGDTVKKGQTIGRSGNTGRLNTTATGPYAGTHLHFEIRKYSSSKKAYVTVDPKLYLPWWK